MKKLFYFIIISFFYNAIKAQCFTSVSLGYYHTLGLKSNGSLWNCGSGGYGQLGNGSETNLYLPTQITTATNWQSITGGAYYSMAIKTNGTLWSSGDNYSGQLGIGSTAINSNTFIQVGTASNWKQVAIGDYFTLGVRTDGTLWAWGQNNEYQMGDGSCCSNRLSPGQIGTATDWKMVGASATSTGMAIKNNGTLWGWGNNNSTGLLGPSNLSGRPTPTQLGTDTNWATMSLGAAHILALKTNGTLWSWGGGGVGENGDTLPPTYFRDTPVQIGTSTWLKVAAAYQFSFGIKSDGTLWAWGLNDYGQLGDGTTVNRMQPIQIGTNNDWAEVAGGRTHAMATKTNGALWAWGLNDYGQFGNGTTTATIVPTAIPVAGCTLGVDAFEKEVFVLTPNPARDEVTLTYGNLATGSSVSLYDLAGRELGIFELQGTTGTLVIPTQNYPSGIYLVVVYNTDGVQAQKKLIIN